MTHPAYLDAPALLKKYGQVPKKSFGQNFLISERIFRAIVDATCASDDDVIVEIGAGVGTLTARLSHRVPNGLVVAVEREKGMIGILNGELSHLDNIEIIEADAMKFTISDVSRWQGKDLTVCGNLPYNIASQILVKLTEARNYAVVTNAVFMIQREMADRLLASPKTREYGPLGVIVGAYYDIKKVIGVPPSAFLPAPRVHSSVVQLTPRPNTLGVPQDWFRKVVKGALGHRRKTLRNSLKQGFDEKVIDASLAELGIDPGIRGDNLSIEALAELASAMSKHSGESS